MAYNIHLANTLREKLSLHSNIKIEKKEIFRGLTFMVNDKMCICVSGDNLMCRFDPKLQEHLAEKTGYEPMVMKGKQLKSYCYVHPEGYNKNSDLIFWLTLCLDFNGQAKASKKKHRKSHIC